MQWSDPFLTWWPTTAVHLSFGESTATFSTIIMTVFMRSVGCSRDYTNWKLSCKSLPCAGDFLQHFGYTVHLNLTTASWTSNYFPSWLMKLRDTNLPLVPQLIGEDARFELSRLDSSKCQSVLSAVKLNCLLWSECSYLAKFICLNHTHWYNSVRR